MATTLVRALCWKCYKITPHEIRNGVVTCLKCGVRTKETDRKLLQPVEEGDTYDPYV